MISSEELSDLSAFNQLEEIKDILIIELTKLEDFSNFRNFEENWWKSGNSCQLKSNKYKEIRKIKCTHQKHKISGNHELTDISALNKLAAIEDYINVNSNYKLSNCALDVVCNLLAEGGGVSFDYNAKGCNLEEVTNSCNK